jgi:hypothetical protein
MRLSNRSPVDRLVFIGRWRPALGDPAGRPNLPDQAPTRSCVRIIVVMLLWLCLTGCANGRFDFGFSGQEIVAAECAVDEALLAAEQAEFFRQAETDRAKSLAGQIERLQADLKTAESALVDAESGLAGSHSRADAVSSLAVTRILVERAANHAPWREVEVESARNKLAEAEGQVEEGRFGAALFFVYRARRVAESLLAEAKEVVEAGHARPIRGDRVNLRASPSTEERVLSVLTVGTPVIPQVSEGQWMLVQVAGGPSGWVYHRLLGKTIRSIGDLPAAPIP